MRILVVFTFLLLAVSAFADDAASSQNKILEHERIVSPNRKYVVESKLIVAKFDVPPLVDRDKGIVKLYRKTNPKTYNKIYNENIHDDWPRYVRLSWSPDSRFLLIGKNYKAYMTIEVIRIAGDHVQTKLLSDDSLAKAIFSKTPFQEKIKTIAPVAHYAWHSLKWTAPDQYTATYVMRGIGYEATLKVLICCQPVSLKILSIHSGFSKADMNDF